MKRMTTMKDEFARTRAKKRKGASFDFAFGATSAALFCCLRQRNTRRLPRFFYAFLGGCGGRGAKKLFFQKRIMASEKADLANENVNNL